MSGLLLIKFFSRANSDTSCTLANCMEPMYINWTIGIVSELLDLVGSAEIATQIIVIALPALRPLLSAFTRGWSRCHDSRMQSRSNRMAGDTKQVQQATVTNASVQGNETVPSYVVFASITNDTKLPEP
ncbi:hypothetical protein CSUB01_06389 [Colletotrichum sublineola]|uniref:Integral membrane protein n=1 Tax=Colletotrichum sublineola TaxID=1173701 RepID=A0A066XCM6_COLSU|nr:hypothetical protein CSUB01_06389 [Colletotrichum sublineola]